MPIYEYKCDSCGQDFEVFARMSIEPMKICSECGSEVRQIFFPFALFMGKVPISMHRYFSRPQKSAKPP